MSSAITINLPWPPTVNTYWRHAVLGGKNTRARATVFLSEDGKAYRVEALAAIMQQRIPRGALHGRLAVLAIAHPPDARTRDLDNLWKSALDALKNTGVIVDDGHIDDLHIKRGAVQKGGSFVLEIRELAEAFESRQQGLDLPPPKFANESKAPF